MTNILIFILGLLIGSFLNAIIYRLEKKESFLLGRSHCPYCRKVLKWHDLAPLLSFILLLGKCRYCRKKISPQYPIVELATGLLFVLIVNKFLSVGLLITGYWLLVAGYLIIIFAYDLKHYIIPDKIIYPAIIIAGIFNFQFSIFNQFSIFQFSIWSALGASVFFLSLVLISQGRWMGWGDVKMAFLMGLILGWPNILVALFLSFFSGAVVGVILILAGKKKMKSEIPFGPFLAGSTIFVMLFGSFISFPIDIIF
ncbi:MAG: prepilin peptidase [Candidatus Portnoybacteria bacterium]